MAEQAWTSVDKSGWGDGPWQDEPDKIQWIDPATGLDCLIVRSNPRYGSLCGYVGLPPEHPLYADDGAEYEGELDVHGGITFAAGCMEDAPGGRGVCHVPGPGRAADVWWLGFDCGHAWDLSPGTTTYLDGHGLPRAASGGLSCETYRTVQYVRAEVTNLAAQLARVAT